MGKLLIATLFFTFTLCDDQPREIETAVFKEIRLSQNDDGSWGNTNKVYCTSFSLLTLLSNGESPVSKLYGETVKKAIQYLMVASPPKNDLDYFTMLYSLSEAYAMTGITLLEKTLLLKIKDLRKRISMNFHKNPELFFIQNEALRSLYSAGIEEKILNEYHDKLAQLTEVESITLIASKARWGLNEKLTNQQINNITKEILKRHQSPIKDLIFGVISFHYNNQKWKQAKSTKFEAYTVNDDSYALADRFTAEEKKYLKQIHSAYYISAVYPMRWLPSSQVQWPKSSDDILEEEGIDLVE